PTHLAPLGQRAILAARRSSYALDCCELHEALAEAGGPILPPAPAHAGREQTHRETKSAVATGLLPEVESFPRLSTAQLARALEDAQEVGRPVALLDSRRKQPYWAIIQGLRGTGDATMVLLEEVES